MIVALKQPLRPRSQSYIIAPSPQVSLGVCLPIASLCLTLRWVEPVRLFLYRKGVSVNISQRKMKDTIKGEKGRSDLIMIQRRAGQLTDKRKGGLDGLWIEWTGWTGSG